MIDQSELDILKAPTASAGPCGPSLEDSAELAAFNGLRVFGQGAAWDQPPDWRELHSRCLETLGRSKDIRILAHLGAALLRTDGIAAFLATLEVAAGWLEDYWDSVHPGLDEDGIFRRNALSCFADRIAIIDAVRRAPLVANHQLGAYSLRDHELAQGTLQPTEADGPVAGAAQIAAAFAAMDAAALAALVAQVEAALVALRRIDAKTREAIGVEGTPDLQPLAQPLQRIQAFLKEQLGTHASAESAAAGEGGGVSGSGGVGGPIRSRPDAIRALDAVGQFFRQTEPSSPVPLFVERAKRLVAKSFLEVLEDMMPDSVAQARQVGGVRDGE